MSEPIVVEHLDHAFGEGELRRQVLFDVSARIRKGEIVILTGPSGSGKTTLLTLIGALRSAQAGSLRVLGRELRGAGEHELASVRSRIGYVFQAHNLLESLSALQNVRMSLELDRALGDAELAGRAREALDAVGLADRADAHPSRLSGGQRQRVAIARALARRPEIVLADEPTASLDRATGRGVVELLQTLARRDGVTVVLVTHDSRILDVADRILALEDGRLSSLMGAVTNDTQRGLRLLVREIRNGDLVRRLAALPATAFGDLLAEITGETRALLDVVDLVQSDAFEGLLEQVVEAFSTRIAALLDADAATLRFREPGGPAAAVGRPPLAPLDRGIAGAAAGSGEAVRVGAIEHDARFDASVDLPGRPASGALLALPLADSRAEVFAVVEVFRAAGRAFDADDERRLHDAAAPVALLLESWWRMSCSCRAAGFGRTCACCGRPWHLPLEAPGTVEGPASG
ncbi:MAG: ATP-binding cassette domain-containing protein [Deltaproteobacteria bacterium]|nr:ATP-binding cassette domain-containing protein [Deltaproteobacteria bacterium]